MASVREVPTSTAASGRNPSQASTASVRENNEEAEIVVVNESAVDVEMRPNLTPLNIVPNSDTTDTTVSAEEEPNYTPGTPSQLIDMITAAPPAQPPTVPSAFRTSMATGPPSSAGISDSLAQPRAPNLRRNNEYVKSRPTSAAFAASVAASMEANRPPSRNAEVEHTTSLNNAAPSATTTTAEINGNNDSNILNDISFVDDDDDDEDENVANEQSEHNRSTRSFETAL